MDVKRFDAVTVASDSQSICTVPSGKAYTITGFTIVQTQGASGLVTLKLNDGHVIGQFGVDGPDTIYPITNVNLAATETLKVQATLSGAYITASVVERDA